MAEESESHSSHLRSYELRLLRCSLPPDRPPRLSSTPSHNATANPHIHALIDDALQSIESGQYLRALSTDAARIIFKLDCSEFNFQNSADSARLFYSELVLSRVHSFIDGENPECGDDESSYRAFLVMVIAVAAFLAFIQCNMTGPLEKLPSTPLMAVAEKEAEQVEGWVEWEAWARNELMLVGCHLLGKFSYLQYIVFAKLVLIRIKDLSSEGSISFLDGFKTILWWLVRVLHLQQRILDERSSSLFDLLHVFMQESLHHFSTVQKVRDYWGPLLCEEEDLAIVSMLHLEVGIMEHGYGRADASRLHFESAEVASKIDVSVTGALGFRTMDQVEPRAQLLLVANTDTTGGGDSCSSGLPVNQENTHGTGKDNLCQHLRDIGEASHVLMMPRFLSEGENSESSAPGCQNSATCFRAVQQAVILAQCLSIEKNARSDDYQRYKMAPYIEAVDSQQSSYFIIRFFCDTLRIRWESTRSRTKERALLMMDKLVQGVYESYPRVVERIYYCFGVYMPTIPALRKEYGDLLVSCGLIGEAVKVYEDLELWDNLIYCYRLLEKKAAAVELIKVQLSECPNDPRLWCSLGDITNNDACYERALEVSENRSARAKRSLARNAYNRGEFVKSKILWESAMALNSLYPDGWFALGAAALKARDVEKALDGFTRAVQLDPDNGESWNNIACLHMIKKRSKEAFIAFKEALKFKRNSWQLWENFSHVALDIGNFSQAMEAVQMVLELTNCKRFDEDLLQKLMLEIEGRAEISCPQSTLITYNTGGTNHIDDGSDVNRVDSLTCNEVGSARIGETEHLLALLGKILQQSFLKNSKKFTAEAAHVIFMVSLMLGLMPLYKLADGLPIRIGGLDFDVRKIVRSGGSAEVWGLYARWHKLKGDYTMCSESLLKQVRSYQGSDLWKDEDRFKKFARASLELCQVYMKLASLSGSRRELFAAEMHLKNTIKQAGVFSDTEEFKDLKACLDMVETKLLPFRELSA